MCAVWGGDLLHMQLMQTLKAHLEDPRVIYYFHGSSRRVSIWIRMCEWVCD
jgi:hypothetical protein